LNIKNGFMALKPVPIAIQKIRVKMSPNNDKDFIKAGDLSLVIYVCTG